MEVQMPNCFKDLQMEGNSTTTFANVKHPVSTLQKVEQAECEQPTSAKSDHYQTICSGNASATEGSWQRLPDCITTPEMLLENTHFDPFDVNGAHTMGNSMPHLEVNNIVQLSSKYYFNSSPTISNFYSGRQYIHNTICVGVQILHDCVKNK